MKVAVCERERYWSETLKTSVTKWASSRKISVLDYYFASPQALLDYMAVHEDMDVVFLDVFLGEEVMDGIALAKKIRKISSSIPIIFVAADSRRAADGYLVEAMGFLQKPVDDGRLGLFLDRLARRQGKRNNIRITTEGRVINVRQDDLVYVEITDHTVTCHTRQGEVSFRGTLGRVQTMLDTDCFIQVHRSYIISIEKIESVKKTYPYSVSLIKNNEVLSLPVGRKYINRLLEVYSNDAWEKVI